MNEKETLAKANQALGSNFNQPHWKASLCKVRAACFPQNTCLIIPTKQLIHLSVHFNNRKLPQHWIPTLHGSFSVLSFIHDHRSPQEPKEIRDHLSHKKQKRKYNKILTIILRSLSSITS